MCARAVNQAVHRSHFAHSDRLTDSLSELGSAAERSFCPTYDKPAAVLLAGHSDARLTH